MSFNINNKRDQCPFNIAQVEAKYNANYVGEFCLKTISGDWGEHPVSVFYVEKPTNPEHSNYFGLFVRGGTVLITNAISATLNPFTGIVADNGEIIYSAYRHDYAVSSDKSVWIDGGRDYFRGPLGGKTVSLQIIDGKIVSVD